MFRYHVDGSDLAFTPLVGVRDADDEEDEESPDLLQLNGNSSDELVCVRIVTIDGMRDTSAWEYWVCVPCSPVSSLAFSGM